MQRNDSSNPQKIFTTPAILPLYPNGQFQPPAEKMGITAPQESPACFLNYDRSAVIDIYPDRRLSTDGIFIPSLLKNADGSIKIAELVAKFNENATKSAFTTLSVRIPFRDAWYLNPGEILIGHRNKIPEIMPFNKDKYILRDMSRPTDTTEVVGTPHKITEPYYGMHGTYVLNVPVGKVALAMSGNIPKIYDTGPHVIVDPNFSFNLQNGFVDKSSPYINHGSIHIVRVPIGNVAKIWINNRPYLLDARPEPYVFNEPLFSIEKHGNNYFFDSTANAIQHGSIHIVRVPIGKIAKIWINNKPFLLEAKNEPYVFNDPLFRIDVHSNDYMFDATANVIQHGTINMIRVPVGTMARIWINNKPFLLEARTEPYVFNDPLFKLDTTGNTNFINAAANVIQHGSLHIVRVPVGKIAKIWLNTKPYLLEARTEPYVINDPYCRIESVENNHFFDATANVIHHGSIHIVRVPVGKVAKIWLNNTPILLEARPEPYIYDEPMFKIEANGNECLFDATATLISHGPIHIVRVPVGKVAKIWLNTMPILLESKPEPYVYNDPIFRIEANGNDNLFDATANVISHGNTHIVRVPSGKIAKVWFDNKPSLLEAKPEPYIFNGTNFKIDKNGNEFFFDATEQLIIHGSLKRIMPHTAQVAITYNGGTLEIIEPRMDNQPINIELATHQFAGFLSTSIDTLEFPGDETKKKRKEENPHASDDEINLDIFTTKDSLRVGVKIMVAYRITDPSKALVNLGSIEGILKHIERCATVDMGKAIQQSSSQEFLCFVQTRPKKESPFIQTLEGNPTPPPDHFQDIVVKQLHKDLADYGIELVRLNIETPKVIDSDLAKELSSQAKQTATASAQASVIDLNNQIAQKKAAQEADTKRIQQEQVNQAKISQAKADLEAARANADAILVRAEAEKKATILKAEAEKQAALLMGEQYITNPKLYDLKIVELQTRMLAAAIEKVQVLPQLPPGIFGQNGMGMPFNFFSSQQIQPGNRLLQDNLRVPEGDASRGPSNGVK